MLVPRSEGFLLKKERKKLIILLHFLWKFVIVESRRTEMQIERYSFLRIPSPNNATPSIKKTEALERVETYYPTAALEERDTMRRADRCYITTAEHYYMTSYCVIYTSCIKHLRSSSEALRASSLFSRALILICYKSCRNHELCGYDLRCFLRSWLEIFLLDQQTLHI